MKNLRITFSVFILIALAACNGSNNNFSTESPEALINNEMQTFAADEVLTKEDGEAHAVDISRKLIKNGSISFKTSNLEKTRSAIAATILNLGGYIANENMSAEDKKNTITISARIPAQNFDVLIAEIDSQASKIDFKSIHVADVTQEFIDLDARLRTKKELEQRYASLLKEAKSVSDILEIEKQINILRADIESTEGRLRYLNKQVSFSTLDITFYDHNPNIGFANKFTNGLKNGWNNLLWVMVALANLWAIIFAIIIVWVAAVVASKRRKKRKNNFHNE